MNRRLHDRLRRHPRFENRPSRAALARGAGVPEVERLSFNESPFGPSPRVIQAVRDEAEALGRYPTSADDELRRAIAESVGRGISPDQVVTGAGAYEVLELLARANLSEGDECILSTPTFEASPRIVELEGGVVVDVPLLRPSFELDADGILGAVGPRTRMVWVCNPNNPSGVGVSAAQMDRLVRELPEDVLLVADEAYHQFVREEDALDTSGLVAAGRSNVCVVHSFSKAYGLAGLRLGYALVPEWLGDVVSRLHRAFHLSRLHLAAGIAALGDPDHVARSARLLLEGREELRRGLEALALRTWPSQTNFLMVDLGQPAAEIAGGLLRFGVQIRPLDDAGLPSYARVNVGSRDATRRLLEGLEQLLDR